jgi:hypothetical protein
MERELTMIRNKLIIIALVIVALSTLTPGVAAQTSTETGPPDQPESGFEIWDNPLAFIGAMVLAATAIGMASKSMAVAMWGGYLTFAHLALESQYGNLENVVYATLALIMVGVGFKLWRLEGGGEA